MEKMRVTQHNARGGKDGAFSAKHNDRNFDAENAQHIDADRSQKNITFQMYNREDPELTFEDAEKRFYSENFTEYLEKQNAKAISQRHPERVRTMDQYRTAMKSCLEEQITQIGNKGNSVDGSTLAEIAVKQTQWEHDQYPNVKIVDFALHLDEATPHIHIRRAWIAHDKDGDLMIGQAKALEEMGVQAPDPTKKITRYNNAKQTYTRECREHLVELCKEYGLDLELEPKEKSKTGLALDEYKSQQEQERAAKLRAEQDKLRAQNDLLTRQNAEMQAAAAKIKEEAEKLQKAAETAQNTIDHAANIREDLGNLEAQREAAKDRAEAAKAHAKAHPIVEHTRRGKTTYSIEFDTKEEAREYRAAAHLGQEIRSREGDLDDREGRIYQIENDLRRREFNGRFAATYDKVKDPEYAKAIEKAQKYDRIIKQHPELTRSPVKIKQLGD